MTILLFLQLQTVSISIAVVALLLFLVAKKHLTGGTPAGIKKVGVWVAPFVFILLFMSAHNRLDAFLLERMHTRGAEEAGIYAMAYRLLDAANMLGYLTGSFLVPFLAKNKTNKATVEKVVLLSRHVLLFFSAAVVSFVFVFSPWVQEVLYYSSDNYSRTIILLCLCCLPAYYLIHVYGSLLTAMALFKTLIQLVLFSFVVNVLLNMVLIPTYGAAGCATAALVSQYGCALLLWITASRRLQLSYAVQTSLLYVATAVVLGGLFFLGQLLTNNVWLILVSIVLAAFAFLITRRKQLTKTFLLFYK
jgi:O-antigen/teichoic acid export membrane protein